MNAAVNTGLPQLAHDPLPIRTRRQQCRAKMGNRILRLIEGKAHATPDPLETLTVTLQ